MKLGRRTCLMFVAAVLLFSSVAFVQPADAVYTPPVSTLKIGLAYGSGTLSVAKVEAEVGSGFLFGYYDDNRSFVQVGYTDKTRLTFLKDHNMYQSGESYSSSGNGNLIGCYHALLNESFLSFEEAQAEAVTWRYAFPAYYSGSYRVLAGAFGTEEEAAAYIAEHALDAVPFSASNRCLSVVETGTDRILFEFDFGDDYYFSIEPYDTQGQKPITWFNRYKYYGGFQFSRLSGDNLTVINYVNIDDYAKGVIPYEMSNSWPVEALKAQALCAKSYALSNLNNHRGYGFDICNTQDCQVYRGLNSANARTNEAVDGVAGKYITYNGELCQTFYSSSDGGATENSENVFVAKIPYLRGVVDPYEANVNTGYANWTYTYTLDDITWILQNKGYSVSDIVSVEPTYTEMGNIYSIKFTDVNGVSRTFSKSAAGSILYSSSLGKYTHSQRFTITPEGGPVNYYVNSGGATIQELNGLYVIGSSGVDILNAPSTGVSVMTGNGVQTIKPGGVGSADKYVVSGSGFGHNVGMSQYGAKAMAELGMTYEQIIKFYFTGVSVD